MSNRIIEERNREKVTVLESPVDESGGKFGGKFGGTDG
jgi:hypothetical protein